jgi:hypothetical protein
VDDMYIVHYTVQKRTDVKKKDMMTEGRAQSLRQRCLRAIERLGVFQCTECVEVRHYNRSEGLSLYKDPCWTDSTDMNSCFILLLFPPKIKLEVRRSCTFKRPTRKCDQET